MGCRRIIIWWVPAYVGLKGNEVVDRLAKLGKTTFIGSESVLGVEAEEVAAAIFWLPLLAECHVQQDGQNPYLSISF